MIAFLAPAILDIVLMLAKFQLYFSFLYGARVLSSERGYAIFIDLEVKESYELVNVGENK
jgi:hypothetical protein